MRRYVVFVVLHSLIMSPLILEKIGTFLCHKLLIVGVLIRRKKIVGVLPCSMYLCHRVFGNYQFLVMLWMCTSCDPGLTGT